MGIRPVRSVVTIKGNGSMLPSFTRRKDGQLVKDSIKLSISISVQLKEKLKQ
jgi:hypothetical protein